MTYLTNSYFVCEISIRLVVDVVSDSKSRSMDMDLSVYLSILLGFIYYCWWLVTLILDRCWLCHDHLVLLNGFLLVFDLDVDWVVSLHFTWLLLLLLHHFLLLIFINYLTIWTQGLHTVTTCCVASQTALVEYGLLRAWWHFSDLAFELQVLAPVAIEVLFLKHCLFVE